VENDEDRRILEKARAVLDEYRKRRERYVGEGKPGVVELLRDWYDDGAGGCNPGIASGSTNADEIRREERDHQ
jgi:hypothetical protein